MMWKKGISATQIGNWRISDSLRAEYADDVKAWAAAKRPPMSREFMQRVIAKQEVAAKQSERASERLRLYREYITLLDRASQPLTSGLTPSEPKFDLSADKVAHKPRRYTPPTYDTVESALAKAKAARTNTERFNRRFD